MQTGLPTLIRSPAGDSRPVSRPTANGAMVSLSSLAANRKRPSGEIAKKRGVLPPLARVQAGRISTPHRNHSQCNTPALAQRPALRPR